MSDLKDGLERRQFELVELEARAADESDGGVPEIVGYAAVYDVESEDLGGFVEIVRAGFFDEVLENDVRALHNHNPLYVLGRNKAETLELSSDRRGLRTRILPPATQWADDLQVSMRRGDVDQMSFTFGVEVDAWHQREDGVVVRELIKASRLADVAIVTYPAYPQTSAEARGKAETFINEDEDGTDRTIVPDSMTPAEGEIKANLIQRRRRELELRQRRIR